MVKFLYQQFQVFYWCQRCFSKRGKEAFDNILSLVNQFDKKGLVVTLKKSDVEAKYSAGSSKGGQKANKSHSIVRLKHLPTNLVSNGRKSRFLPKNYEYALAELRMLVDVHTKGDESVFVIHKKEKEEKTRRELEIKKALKIKRLENEEKLKEILSEEDTLNY